MWQPAQPAINIATNAPRRRQAASADKFLRDDPIRSAQSLTADAPFACGGGRPRWDGPETVLSMKPRSGGL